MNSSDLERLVEKLGELIGTLVGLFENSQARQWLFSNLKETPEKVKRRIINILNLTDKKVYEIVGEGAKRLLEFTETIKVAMEEGRRAYLENLGSKRLFKKT